MRYFRIILLFKLFFFLTSCGTLKEGFKNPKKENSDEFLVEKKSPLVMPPNFNELPIPNKNNLTGKDDNNIKSLIISEENNKTDTSANVTNQELDNSILNKIKKN